MTSASRPTIYVTDLDGTLLDRGARLSARTREGLARLLDEGLLLTVASARSVVAMQVMLEGLSLPLPVVEFHGAFVSELETGRHLVTNALDPEVASEVYETAAAAGIPPFVSTFDGDLDRLYYAESPNDGFQAYVDDRVKDRDPRLTLVRDVRAHLSEDVVSLTHIDLPDRVESLRSELVERFGDSLALHKFSSIYWPGWEWMTVHDPQACKGRGLTAMLELSGMDGAEVVALGDGDSDIPLFEAADRGVAVENATSGLKAIASEVIGPHTEDSVVEFLEREWLEGRAGGTGA